MKCLLCVPQRHVPDQPHVQCDCQAEQEGQHV